MFNVDVTVVFNADAAPEYAGKEVSWTGVYYADLGSRMLQLNLREDATSSDSLLYLNFDGIQKATLIPSSATA